MQTNSLHFQLSDKPFFKFLPAFLMMLAIFLFSARPADPTPLTLIERIIYKGGHVIGFALLALCYWRACRLNQNMRWIAWFLAVLYAVTDEYHQSFVPGRHPTAFDVLVYDNIGAFTSLWLANRFMKQKQPASKSLVVENPKR
jgi:VanZ family protein